MAKANNRAPKSDAYIRGKTMGSTAQEANYKKVVDKWRPHENKGRGASIKTAWNRGKVIRQIEGDKDNFGPKTTERIALDFGVKTLTAKQSVRFFEYVDEAGLEELLNLEEVPSWRMLGKWVTISNEDDRQKVLKAILSGELTNNKFNENLNALLGRGPRKPRRVRSGTATFEKVGTTAVSFAEQLTWLDDAFKAIDKLEDDAAKKSAKKTGKESLKQLKLIADRLAKSIEQMEHYCS